MAELGGPQISALLESVPGIANVLRSPVADAMVNMIRAGARQGEFRFEDAQELVQFATRRGLIGSDEGDRVLGEVRGAGGRRAVAAETARGKTRARPARAAKVSRRPATKPRKAAARKAKPAKASKGKKKKR